MKHWINKKKVEAAEKKVDRYRKIKSDLDDAKLEYARALGLTDDQAARLIK